MSKSRIRVIATILSSAAIVAIGLGLGLALRKSYRYTDRNGGHQHTTPLPTTPYPTSTTKSPLHNPPSDSKEGHYRFAAVAADAEECSQIGT